LTSCGNAALPLVSTQRRLPLPMIPSLHCVPALVVPELQHRWHHQAHCRQCYSMRCLLP
jgi:hypothetical protein